MKLRIPNLRIGTTLNYPKYMISTTTPMVKTKSEKRYSTNNTANDIVRTTSQQTKPKGHRRVEKKPTGRGTKTHNQHSTSTSTSVFQLLRKLLRSNRPLYVRELPDNFKYGKHALQLATEKASHKHSSVNGTFSYIDNIEWFGKLRHIRNEFPEGNARLHEAIETYLKELDKKYREINRFSIQSLNQRIAEFDAEWERQHGGLPDLKLLSIKNHNNKISNKKKSREGSSGDSKLVNGLDDTEKREPIGKEIEKEWKDAKLYKSQLEALKRNHIPKVHAMPGTSRFDYLATLIRLVASRQTILFCIDIEAFEGNNKILTEIGISIFDPRENVNSLIPLTRDFHLIVAESLEIRNGVWVCDTKECYLMGKSIVLSMAECVAFIQSLIDFYMVPQTPEDNTWYRAYVAHNARGDVEWLQHIGIKMPHQNVPKLGSEYQSKSPQSGSSEESTVERQRVPFIFDTAKLCQESYGNDGASLGKMLRLFGIPHAYLHNAGNDSNFTLKLLLHLCDIEYRQRFHLDDIGLMQRRARLESERSKNEPKVLPMLYLLTIREAERRAMELKERAEIAEISNSNGSATTEAGNKVTNQAGEGQGNKNEEEEDHDGGKSKKKTKGTRSHPPQKDLVPQTEFGGMQWFPDAYSAFKSVTSFTE